MQGTARVLIAVEATVKTYYLLKNSALERIG